jgi:plastocyanin
MQRPSKLTALQRPRKRLARYLNVRPDRHQESRGPGSARASFVLFVVVLIAMVLLAAAGGAAVAWQLARPDRPAAPAAATARPSQAAHAHGGAPTSPAVTPVGGMVTVRVDELAAGDVEFQWKPDNLLLAAGQRVTLKIANADYMQHNFTLKAVKVAENLPVGKTTTIRFTAPTAGAYRFYCKYHLQMMDGAITVR